MPKRKTRRQLKVGDNLIVTVENIIPSCLFVSLIFQNKKYCGALMDTTKKDGPYGIPVHPENQQDEAKDETKQRQETSKASHKTPFPQPLLTRETYYQNVAQPPLRNIFRRIRRSRRKARLNILKPSRDGSLKPNRGWKFLSHSPSCQCCDCIQGVQEVKPKSALAKNVNKEETDETEIPCKRPKFEDVTPATTSDEDSDVKSVKAEEIASPIKTLLPRNSSYKSNLQRSPVIKITYKSPGGRGRCIEIPSRPHHSPIKEDPIKNGNENVSCNPIISTNVVGEKAKRKYVRRNTAIKKNDDVSDCSLMDIKKNCYKPQGAKRKYVRRQVSEHKMPCNPLKTSVVEVKEVKKTYTKKTASMLDGTSTIDTPKKGSELQQQYKHKYVKKILPNQLIEIAKPKGNISPSPKRKYVKHKYEKTDLSLRSGKDNQTAYIAPVTHKLEKDASPLLGQTYKNNEKVLSNPSNNHNVVALPIKQNVCTKKNGEQELAMRVLKRAKQSTFGIPQQTMPVSQLMELPLSSESHCPSAPSHPKKDKHLRVMLQPLEGKNGLTLPLENSSPMSKYNRLNNPKHHLGILQSSSKNLGKKLSKKEIQPQSHTIYVTRCTNIKGTFTQGDIVWSKLTGYPWWPSRIVKLIVTKTDGKVLQQEAKVAWLRSRTTSIIPLRCVQSFEKHFEIRFEKKRKGLYQKAVNDAREALKEISPEAKKLIAQFET